MNCVPAHVEETVAMEGRVLSFPGWLLKRLLNG